MTTRRYRVECEDGTPGMRHHCLYVSYPTLPAALVGMTEEQQCGWASVSLTPVDVPQKYLLAAGVQRRLER